MIIPLFALPSAFAEIRPVDGFHGVVNQAPVHVTITIGPTAIVQVEGSLERTQQVLTEVRKGILVVTTRNDTVWKGGEPPTVNITVPSLDQIGAEGAGNVTVTGTLESNDLQLWTRGAGSLAVDHVKGRTVSLVAEGAGDLTATNVRGDTVLLASRGGSDVRATSVLGDATVYEVVGAGTFHVQRHSGGTVDARIQGAGSLTVVGAAEKVLVAASGAARVELGGLRARVGEVEAKGASTVHVWTDESLVAHAGGASKVITSGSGRVASSVSGAGAVRPHGAPATGQAVQP